MTVVPIDVGAALIFLASCAVGYAVFRHTRARSMTVPKQGDVGVAFTAGAAALIALAFLFGVPSERGSRDGRLPMGSQSTAPAVPGPLSGTPEVSPPLTASPPTRLP